MVIYGHNKAMRKKAKWHQEQNLPVVVLRKANLFKRVVSAL